MNGAILFVKYEHQKDIILPQVHLQEGVDRVDQVLALALAVVHPPVSRRGRRHRRKRRDRVRVLAAFGHVGGVFRAVAVALPRTLSPAALEVEVQTRRPLLAEH